MSRRSHSSSEGHNDTRSDKIKLYIIGSLTILIFIAALFAKTMSIGMAGHSQILIYAGLFLRSCSWAPAFSFNPTLGTPRRYPS